jgi:hypothetical protein
MAMSFNRWWLALIPLTVGLCVWYVEFYHEPPMPSQYETRCFNSEGKQLYRSIDAYHPHITRWGKVTCIVRGLK